MKLKRLATMSLALIMLTGISVSAKGGTWLKKNSHRLDLTEKKGDKDLAFLKPLLKGKTVVALGENFHRVAEYSSMKVRIIKYLHEKLGYDVVAFETCFGDAAVVNENIDSMSSNQAMINSLHMIWHSKETAKLFDYIKEQKKTKHPLYLAGYDNQPTSLYFNQVVSYWVGSLDKNRGDEFSKFDLQYIQDCYSVINKYGEDSYKHKDILKDIETKYKPKYDDIIKFMEDNKEKLISYHSDKNHIYEATIRYLKQRMSFVRQSMYGTVQSYTYRDKLMAANYEWLTKVMYPGKKVILWAHNDHIAKNTSKIQQKGNKKWISSFTSMGEMLNKKLGNKEYVLGLYMNRGRAAEIETGKVFNIKPMPKGSMENYIIRNGYKNSFIDMSKQNQKNKNNAWMFNRVYAAEDGLTDGIVHPMDMRFIPKQQYDGIILIDKVKEPTLFQYTGN
ncbi:erythromycin esterase family protein [Clostridium oryzae]|uniref:Erythromycin esterase n=1 Tax=Clostridium oryzae TaxID=1450648 RepID=A0A1V4IIP6_9CLOT|nr:erythromycin esterase family protein [Clostridium oryzae]OPJ59878.1 erythromycin esterase [Clostridium oryzae]